MGCRAIEIHVHVGNLNPREDSFLKRETFKNHLPFKKSASRVMGVKE